MVHRGPSTGCAKCRQRHVRCDQTKPACKRCASLGVICPGYRDFGGVVFRDVSSSVVLKHSRPPPSKHSSAPPASDEALLRPSVPRELGIDPQAACISLFFRSFASRPSRDAAAPGRGPGSVSRGHLDLLVPLYAASAPSSPLAQVVLVLASRAAALYLRQSQTTPWHLHVAAEAAQALRSAIADPAACMADETLLAVLCLDFAQRLLTTGAASDGSRAHLDGAVALVQYRGPASFNTPISRSLLAVARSNALAQYLYYGDHRSQAALAQIPDVDMGDCSPAVGLHRILARVLRLETVMVRGPKASPVEGPRLFATSCTASARGLDVQLLDWWAHLPLHWSTAVPRQPTVGPRPAHATANDSSLVQIAYVCGQWHCTRLMVLKMLYAAIIIERGEGPWEDAGLRHVLEDAQEVAEGLCAVLLQLEGTHEALAHDHSSRVGFDVSSTPSLPRQSRLNGASGHWYVSNILSWSLATLHGEVRGAEAFAVHPETRDFLREKHRLVQASSGNQSQFDRLEVAGMLVPGGRRIGVE